MTNQTIPPCPVCGVVPVEIHTESYSNGGLLLCGCDVTCDADDWYDHCAQSLYAACRELGIETVEQVRELVGIACDACDERTVRAANRAENLVPLLRRRAAKGEKKYGR